MMCYSCPSNRQTKATKIVNGSPVCDTCAHNPEALASASKKRLAEVKKEREEAERVAAVHKSLDPKIVKHQPVQTPEFQKFISTVKGN